MEVGSIAHPRSGSVARFEHALSRFCCDRWPRMRLHPRPILTFNISHLNHRARTPSTPLPPLEGTPPSLAQTRSPPLETHAPSPSGEPSALNSSQTAISAPARSLGITGRCTAVRLRSGCRHHLLMIWKLETIQNICRRGTEVSSSDL